MEKIETTYELKTLDGTIRPVKVKVLQGAYPVIITEIIAKVQVAVLDELVQNMVKTYNLDPARLVVIGHPIPEPFRVGNEELEWLYYDFKRDKDLKPTIGNSSLKKVDVNLVFALLERSCWSKEMDNNSKPSFILLKTLKDSNREVYVVYNDGISELKATLAPSMSRIQAQNIVDLLAKEAGLSQIKEESE